MQELTPTQQEAKNQLMLKPAIAGAYGLMAACSLNLSEMEHNIHGWLYEFVSETDSDETDVAKIIQQTSILIYDAMSEFKSSVQA